jgi:hypothetical protein
MRIEEKVFGAKVPGTFVTGGSGGKGLRRWLPTRECRPPLRPGLPDSPARLAEIQAAVASSPSRTTNTASNSSQATSDAGTAARKARSRCHRLRPWPPSTHLATTAFAQMASWFGCEMTSGGGGFGNYSGILPRPYSISVVGTVNSSTTWPSVSPTRACSDTRSARKRRSSGALAAGLRSFAAM